MRPALTQRPIVEVVPRRTARPAAAPSSPLPATVLTALASISADMRDVPRDCIRDPAELVLWLRRMAGRVEGVSRMTVPGRKSEIPTASPHRPEGMVKMAAPSSIKTGLTAEKGMLPARCLHDEDTLRLSGQALADAVFGKGPHSESTPAKDTHILRTPSRRIITSRKGCTVEIETRRSTPATQFDMFA